VSTNGHSPTPAAAVDSWLSPERFARYLNAAEQDHDLALQLYSWNATVAAACLRDVGHLEVALRNAYDMHLSVRFSGWGVDPTSQLFIRMLGPQSNYRKQNELNTRSSKDLEIARNGLGASPTHGQVIASLMFGFWAKMTHKDREASIWTPMLRHAFPAHTSRGQVHELVSRIVRFRNRLAHNEPVFSSKTGLKQRLTDVGLLFAMVHPDAARWVLTHSSAPTVITNCPVPHLITDFRNWPTLPNSTPSYRHRRQATTE
jgi:hypothetical protein